MYSTESVVARDVPGSGYGSLLLEAHLAKFDLRQYARRGAEARVAELNAELSQIYRLFPEMRRRRVPAANAAVNSQTETLPRRRRRRGMTAAQRRAVSARMKKYWAARRKAQGN